VIANFLSNICAKNYLNQFTYVGAIAGQSSNIFGDTVYKHSHKNKVD